MSPRVYALFALLASLCNANALELDNVRIVDLSHPYSPDTLYWPTSPSAFEKDTIAFGDSGDGYFYSAFAVSTPEHGGTHLDAPLHFYQNGVGTSEVPLEKLVVPAVVIDISAQASADRNYRLTVNDVLAFEESFGRIGAGSAVLARTNWSRHWPDAREYLGDDVPGDASNLQFPGFSAEAVEMLTGDRNIALLGIDTASIDYGQSQDFVAHRIGAAAGVPNLENLTNLDQLPETGSIVIALPMKIAGGSGGPARVIALVPD